MTISQSVTFYIETTEKTIYTAYGLQALIVTCSPYQGSHKIRVTDANELYTNLSYFVPCLRKRIHSISAKRSSSELRFQRR